MGCKSRILLKYLQLTISMVSTLLGFVLLVCSHALYMHEKASFYKSHHLTSFNRSLGVELLDDIGIVLILTPLLIFTVVMVLKCFKKFIQKRKEKTLRASGS